MAATSATMQQLRSSTAGVRPTSLLQGQIFINEEDAVLCWPDTDGTIRTTWLSNAQGAPKVITTATYTVLNTDQYLVFSPTVACTITLPTPTVAMAGRTLTIKNISALLISASVAVVKPLTSNTAGTAILLGTAGKWATLVCDGTAWVIMQGN